MIRTRVIIVAVLSAAVLLVTGTIVWRTVSGDSADFDLVAARPQVVRIQVITALPVEAWVQAAADEFNAAGHSTGDATIEVDIVPMDGLVALGKWERNDFAALPTDVRPEDLSKEDSDALQYFPAAWIADSSYLVDFANASNRDRLERDPFLSDGQYRVRPLAETLLVWGLFRSRGTPLLENLGPISWATIREAAVAPTGWKELGGDPAWGNFKLAVPAPGKSAAGLAVIISAAGEYYDRTEISFEDLSDPQFVTWLTELMGAAANVGGDRTDAAANVALFGFTAGDGGQFLESNLLARMEGITTRWQEPVTIHYPKVTTWFDFPFAIWVGPETSAKQKNAVSAFQRFLLSEAQQRRALSFGLRPIDPSIPVDPDEDSLFLRWHRLGVKNEIPRTDVMQTPDRKLLPALLRWQNPSEAP